MIRTAAENDEKLLAGLIRVSFQDVARRFGLTQENCPKHPSNCSADWIHRDLSRGVQYYVLEADGKACGCAGLEQAPENVGYLERLAVLPHARRRGYGARLVNRVVLDARRLDMATISIGIIAQQTELVDWYRKMDFMLGESKRFPHLPFTVAFMTLKLHEKPSQK